jgi:hypothetical protein
MKISASKAALAAFALASISALGAAEAASFKSGTGGERPGGYAAQGGGQSKGHVETCNNIASCNLMIAYCESHGGSFDPTGTPGPQGEPKTGKCTYP